MPSTYPRVTVKAASLPADGQLGQDRHFIGDDFVIVLDGASSPIPSDRNGGWYAEVLGADLSDRLLHSASTDLRGVLNESIANVARRYDLQPGKAPSSTVAIARWDTAHLHAMVLGDSSLIAQTRSGATLQLRDNRLASVARAERETYRNALRHGEGYGQAHRRYLRRLVEVEHAHRNQLGGYWIAEAEPEAATHAVRARWALDEITAVLVVTDGASRGIEQYHVLQTWQDAFRFIRDQSLDRLLELVHESEERDENGQRWPRSKIHDDKTAVLIELVRCCKPAV